MTRNRIPARSGTSALRGVVAAGTVSSLLVTACLLWSGPGASTAEAGGEIEVWHGGSRVEEGPSHHQSPAESRTRRPPPGKSSLETARELMTEAERLAEAGSLDAAIRLAGRAERMNVDWPAWETSPAQLRRELERRKARSERDWFGRRQTEGFENSSNSFGGSDGGSDNRFRTPSQGTGTTDERFLIDSARMPQRERGSRSGFQSNVAGSWGIASDEHAPSRLQKPATRYERSTPDQAPAPPEEQPRETPRPSAEKNDEDTSSGDTATTAEGRKADEERQNSGNASEKPVPVNVHVQAPSRTPQPATVPEQTPEDSSWTTAALYLAAALGGALLAALLLVLVGQSFLKRYAHKLSPVFRVELVNAEGQTLSALPVGWSAETQEPTAEPSAETPDPTLRVRDFADGDVPLDPESTMTFADRKAQEKEEFRRKEQAVIKHVFEQNVELRQQLSGRKPAAM